MATKSLANPDALHPVLMSLQRGINETLEDRMRKIWLRFEFGMELAAQEVGVRGQFDDFRQVALG